MRKNKWLQMSESLNTKMKLVPPNEVKELMAKIPYVSAIGSLFQPLKV
jgi:hypothetical protein